MFPERRMRRCRSRVVQPLLYKRKLSKKDLICPLFVDETIEQKVPIAEMPGQFRYSLHEIADKAEEIWRSGIPAILLFGIPKEKDCEGSAASRDDGVIQKAVRAVKARIPELIVITDLCACEYTTHGHCGLIEERDDGPDLLNDESLELMNRIAISQARSGADIVAPSCMLDGMVSSIRKALDDSGYQGRLIMSYSSKFCSAFYGPFREAAQSRFTSGDRSTYQIYPGNSREAILEAELDKEEGADILMVKPAGMYLDIVSKITQFGLPVAAYQVSGEYSMIKAASNHGWITERAAVLESLECIKRAGAEMIITYYAHDVARWLDEE